MQYIRQPTVYLLASRRNGTLYVGVTSNPLARLDQHRRGLREKQIKKWNRKWKLQLIEAANPDWRDLAEDLGFESLDKTGSPLSRG